MSASSTSVTRCGYCGLPVLQGGYFGSVAFHFECARPSALLMSEDRVRQIVREELEQHAGAATPAKD